MNLHRSASLIALGAALALAGAAPAQSIFVDTSADVVDFGGSQQVADLPGPDGRVSLPEAGLASDNTPGVQTIGFHVPQNEWLYQWLYPGRAVLKPFLGFRIFQPAIIDATTQTAFTGDTNPQGGEVVLWAEFYVVNTTGSVVRGFDNSSISVSGGSANVVQGNSQAGIEVYDSPFTLIGGAGPGEGNSGGTIKIDRSHDNVVIGNTVQRVRVLGWIAGGQPASNVRVGGPTAAERNFITGYGTWSEEGYPGGTTLQIFDSIDLVVENNWIGTTPDGMAQGSLASTQGIGFEGENHGALIRNNRIAGILGHGIGPHYAGWLVGSAIDVYGTGSDITLVGNTIGLNANGEPVLGSVTGIATRNYYLGPIQNVVIGGALPGEGNVVAGHLGPGISVANTYAGVRIAGNAIHDNGGLGIDLVTNGFQVGVTPNDPLDVDAGGNGLQNFPELQSAALAGSTVRVIGTLDSTPSSSFALDFYASPQCDPSGFGEGRNFLGSATVATNAGGSAAFDVTLVATVAPSSFVTATATAANGSTSEFSACVEVSGSQSQWTNLGHGLAGSTGVPLLAGTGALTAGSVVHWSLANAKSSAAAWIVVGFSQANLPLGGGLLVPAPDVLVPTVTDGIGALNVPLLVPAPLPGGQQISTQIWVLDPVGIAGLAASNAIAATAP